MDEYTINEDGEIVYMSDTLPTENIMILLNTYQRLAQNHEKMLALNEKIKINDNKILDLRKMLTPNKPLR